MGKALISSMVLKILASGLPPASGIEAKMGNYSICPVSR
jgi:hypothetical protein